MWFRKKAEAGLDAELRYHFERLVRESIAAGIGPDEARRRARLEFGGVEAIKEECRDVRRHWLEDFDKDLRYAARTLRRSPGFLIVSVLSLGLGIGANTAIFSLINAVMLRPLPVKDPGRLVQTTRLRPNGKPADVSYPLFQYFRDNMKSISGAAAEMESNPTIEIDGSEELVKAELVSGDHYSVLGITPCAGRLLERADDIISPAAPAAVISYQYWRRRFALNPAAIGKRITLQVQRGAGGESESFTIVGVTPPNYEGTRLGTDPDITLPLVMMLNDEQRHEDTYNMLNMLARLAPGATIEQANSELQVLWRNFAQRVAASLPEKDRPIILSQRAAVLNAASGLGLPNNDYSDALLVLMGIVALVLLLACANLSGLLLARASSRQREISIRLAIGAGSGRLMRQFLTESLLLAVLGGASGLLLAHWFSNALITMMANGGTLLLSTTPDWRVLAFTAAISLASCVLAGLMPGLHALRVNVNPGLKQARAGNRQRLGKSLVVAQLSISMVLVVGASLFAGTLAKLYRVDRGLRTDGVLTFRLRTSERYPPDRRWTSIPALLDKLNVLPGVASASAVDVLPISGSLWDRNVQVEGYTFGPDENEGSAFNAIAPKYFATTGTPLVMGREFDQRDTKASAKVTIVNESFARYFFGPRSPLGHRVTSVNVAYQVVGVVKDAKYQDLRQEVMKTMYIPWTQRDGEQPSDYNFVARVSAGDPMRLVPALEELVRETDSGLRLRNPQTYSAVVDQSMVTERIMATLGGFFGLLALIVACLGVFGAMAFQVSQRVNEIGLRMALGAKPGGIVALILSEVTFLLVAGCLVGGAAALTLTGLTRKMLYGVTPTEPGIFALAAVILGAAAFTAGWLPAHRAARIDPMVALRHD
jgi:predicted permease